MAAQTLCRRGDHTVLLCGSPSGRRCILYQLRHRTLERSVQPKCVLLAFYRHDLLYGRALLQHLADGTGQAGHVADDLLAD
ncbi:hypothetical protein D3C76_1456930 [compost metagenome]